MAKKKKSSGGKHKTPRTPVQFPKDWLAYARRQSAKKRQPVMWWLIGLIADAGSKDGDEAHPPFPWETEPRKDDSVIAED